MKKIILLSFVCLSIELFAQKSFFGINGGINVSNQRYHYINTTSNSSSTSFFENLNRPTVGGFYQFNFSEAISVRINVQYQGLGYRYAGPTYGTSYGNPPQGTDIKLNYISFPVSIGYNANSHLMLSAGTYLGYLLGGSKINGQVVTSLYDRYDSGLLIGGEYDIYKGIGISMKYMMGLSNIWIESSGGYSRSSYTNRALQFALVYKFIKFDKPTL